MPLGPGWQTIPRKTWRRRYTQTLATNREYQLVIPVAHRRSEPLLIVVQLNFVSDACSLVQHGGNRAVFLFRKPDGVLNRLARHLPRHPVAQLDLDKNTWWFGSLFGLSADFNRDKW